MGSETLPNQFIFNEKMDKEALYSLYADDFAYIEEIFSTVLQNFDADFSSIELAYQSGNAEDLKRAVHKMKPTFGYTGLMQTQLDCKNYEDRCAAASSVAEVADGYSHIKNVLLEAKDIIQSDYTRLKAFNANQL